MFANRYTAFIDACVLASVLRRNLLLTLAEAEFFRVRWSADILRETQRAIAAILMARQYEPDDANARALRAVTAMREAFVDVLRPYAGSL